MVMTMVLAVHEAWELMASISGFPNKVAEHEGGLRTGNSLLEQKSRSKSLAASEVQDPCLLPEDKMTELQLLAVILEHST